MVHDWGGLIGLRWACDHPGAARALAISDTGFFPDGKWHGMAKALRTEGEGEQFMDNVSRDLLGMALRQISPGMTEADVDECWKCLSTPERRAGVLELYRSGDFEKLEPYEGKLGALGVPTRLIWAESDEFAPVAGAHRLAAEIPGRGGRDRGRRPLRGGGRPRSLLRGARGVRAVASGRVGPEPQHRDRQAEQAERRVHGEHAQLAAANVERRRAPVISAATPRPASGSRPRGPGAAG